LHRLREAIAGATVAGLVVTVIAPLNPGLEVAIATAGQIAGCQTVVFLVRVAIVAFFRTRPYDFIAACSVCTANEARIRIERIPIVTLLTVF
jgi:hypothetical protein